MNKWANLQSEVVAWAATNFGHTPLWLPIMGMVEECGEYYVPDANIIMQGKNIRTFRLDAIGDSAIYALNACEVVGLNFADDVVDLGHPVQVSPKELLGSLALMCHGVLKNHQGIRGMDRRALTEAVRLGLGVWYRWANYEAMTLAPGSMVIDITNEVWSEVKRRDWVKNPTDAAEIARTS